MKKATINKKGLPTGFYDPQIHGDRIPPKAIEMSDADWQAHNNGDQRRHDGTGWVPYTPPFDPTSAIAAQAAKIEAGYSLAMNQITALYPSTERESWSVQEAEANAWTADNAAATPFLSALAKARAPMTVADLASSIITKASAFKLLAADAIGKRRTLVDALAALDTTAATIEADIDAIIW